MAAFDFDGNKYKLASSHQKAWGSQVIDELSAGIIGNEHILDLGCGDGVLTEILSRLVPDGKVTGIDFSAGMIETAKDIQAPNLCFNLEDINLFTKENSFDIIFSNAALHWLGDHKRLLQNCFKNLKPGGIIRFNFAEESNCPTFFAIIKELMHHPDFKEQFKGFKWPWYLFDVDRYNQFLKESAFNEYEVWKENADTYFEDEEALTGWLDQPSLVPFLQPLDDFSKKTLRNLVIYEMKSKTVQPDGRYLEKFRRINVLARKL